MSGLGDNYDSTLGSRLDKAVEALQDTNLHLESLAGQIELMKTRMESMESMNTLKAQVTETQIRRLEDGMTIANKNIDSMKTQISKAQAVFAVIAAIAMAVVGFIQQLFFQTFGGHK